VAHTIVEDDVILASVALFREKMQDKECDSSNPVPISVTLLDP
jgi:hypothetical protein